MALVIPKKGVTKMKVATIGCTGMTITTSAPSWATVVTEPSTNPTTVYVTVGSNTGDVRTGTTTINYTGNGASSCSQSFVLRQEGTATPTGYNFTLKIRNDSSYITDFTDITLTVYSPTPETITILNDFSGVPTGTTTQGIPYTASTEGNTVACVCVVTNNKYPGGEIRTIPCYGFCDVAGDETVTFRYDDTV